MRYIIVLQTFLKSIFDATVTLRALLSYRTMDEANPVSNYDDVMQSISSDEEVEALLTQSLSDEERMDEIDAQMELDQVEQRRLLGARVSYLYLTCVLPH